jgi:Protein of unknown function (DUF3025)
VRFVAPARAAVDATVFARPPLSLWGEFADLLGGVAWPDVAALNARASPAGVPRFVAQTRDLECEDLHYEMRIATRNEVATRERNWHDLLNALVWMRFPALKSALNVRQAEGIRRAGTKRRTRAQCALTHFDEAGVVVLLRDESLLPPWDAHDWHGLFWRARDAWREGRIEAVVFGHALLEHALRPGQLLVGKALACAMPLSGKVDSAIAHIAAAIRSGELLNDPQELRPLPLSGIPGWHPGNRAEVFYRTEPCFRPLRAGRTYPAPSAVELHQRMG